MLRTFRTAKPLFRVKSALVGSEMPSRLKRHWAFLPCCRINMWAWKRLLVQMHRHDMFLERRVLPKRLIAGRILRAAKLVPPIMCSQMSPEP